MNFIERISPNTLSSLVRWGLGLTFAIAGFLNNSWIAVGFGSLMFITGFFKPRRCTESGCDIGSDNQQKNQQPGGDYTEIK